MSQTRILLIEDNRYLREGWMSFLEKEADFSRVEAFGSCEDAIAAGAPARCDVVLLDIGLPGMNGIEGVRHFRAQKPDLPIVMATVFDDDTHIFDALEAGAVGYILKKSTPEEIIAALKSAVAGGSPLTPNIARRVIERFHSRPPTAATELLTERERQILEAMASGRSYAAIGRAVHLSEDGVRYHIRNIYRKLQVNSKTQAVRKGLDTGLIRSWLLF